MAWTSGLMPPPESSYAESLYTDDYMRLHTRSMTVDGYSFHHFT